MDAPIKATITADGTCSNCGSEEIYISKKTVNHWKLTGVNGEGQPEFEWHVCDEEDDFTCRCEKCNSEIDTEGNEEFI